MFVHRKILLLVFISASSLVHALPDAIDEENPALIEQSDGTSENFASTFRVQKEPQILAVSDVSSASCFSKTKSFLNDNKGGVGIAALIFTVGVLDGIYCWYYLCDGGKCWLQK